MHCVMALKREFSKLELDSAQVEIGTAKVKYDENKIDFSMIQKAVADAGFQLEPQV